MPSSLVFDNQDSYTIVSGDIGGITAPLQMGAADYQAVRVSATVVWLKPLTGGIDIGQFTNADLATPYNSTDDLFTALVGFFAASGAFPAGLATAARQDLLLAELQLKADLTQTQPVRQATLVSTLNSTTTLLNAAAVFTGTWEDVSGDESVSVVVATDQDGTFTVQFSPDGTNIDSTLTRYYRTASINPPQIFIVTRKYCRVTFTNTSASNQTYLRLQTILGSAGLLNIPIDSTMSQNYSAISVRPTDYHYEVALGLRQGRAHWDIWGNNTDIDIGTEIVRSLGGTTVSNITAATTFTFVSTSANDTSAGTGARSLVVYYVDSDRKAQIGVVTLNGTTPVVSAFSGLGINRISIYLAGSGQANAGTITCTETTGGAAVAEIRTGEGTNQTTVFYVQASATALVKGMSVNLVKPGGGTDPVVTIKGWVFSFVSNAKYLIFSKTVDTAIDQNFDGNIGDPFPIGEKSIFWFEATTTQNDTAVSIRYSLIETKAASA